jgi:hypothetical protein
VTRLRLAPADLAAAVLCCWCDRTVGACRCDLVLAPFDPTVLSCVEVL